ncbi:hypothetical protein QAD02_008995 [Eretmocerus hayati]|uniref:Uncharacterized protein n=1 Tax=Eretmocerus hayati TaxID=131215 RepID=A0ACC2N8S0_9HYME|nr:hypothetical protein QAD02_008995 [Eretmocerus hayati]
MNWKTSRKVPAGVSWTSLELEGLVEDEDSCVFVERKQKHLGLHPYHLSNLSAALREILDAGLNRYDQELNGLLLSYKNPKLLSPLGDILYDTCFVHVDVEADFYIFRPEVGKSLKGIVNKVSYHHIGVLLHKIFNVSIRKPDIKNGEESNWPEEEIHEGQEVRFTLEDVDYKTRIPYMRGSFNKEDYLKGCQVYNEGVAASYASEFQKITRRSVSFSDDNDQVKKESLQKSSNKRIVFDSDSDSEPEINSVLEKKPSIQTVKVKTEPTDEEIQLKKKKKKSKVNGVEASHNGHSASHSDLSSQITGTDEENISLPKKSKKKVKTNAEDADHVGESSKKNSRRSTPGPTTNSSDDESYRKVRVKSEPPDEPVKIKKKRKRKREDTSLSEEGLVNGNSSVKSEPKEEDSVIPKKKRKKEMSLGYDE